MSRIARISFTTAQPQILERFYSEALGFESIAEAKALGYRDTDARATVLRLGQQFLELVSFRHPGSPYAANITANDLRFQHIAIVVSDMAAAYGRLRGYAGWTPITESGPQVLPASSGGVTAFKFRDPEGHPLELLAFPQAAVPDTWRQRQVGKLLIGIDHSAISVADTKRSIGFYEKLFGFSIAAQTKNAGAEQARLDDLDDPVVEVTSLFADGQDCPHLELLCYQEPKPRDVPLLAESDVAATRLVIEVDEDKLTAIADRIRDDGSQAPSGFAGALEPKQARPLRESQATLIHDRDGHALMLTGAGQSIAAGNPAATFQSGT